MAKRKAISKRIRFDVFKRDSFTCQYCGRKAPDVVLQVDHIVPVKNGGKNTSLNLATSCAGCNAGKSCIPLDDASVVAVQRRQVEQLQQRREQIEMIAEWQRGLLDAEIESANAVAKLWSSIAKGYSLNEHGLRGVRKLVRDFGLAEVLSAIPVAGDTYLRTGNDGQFTKESVEHAFKKLGGICFTRREETKHPELQELYRIRGLAKHRCSWFKSGEALALLQEAVAAGIGLRKLWDAAGACTSWSNFEYRIECLMEDV